MCKAMEDMRNEAIKSANITNAKRMLALGKLSYEEIAQCSSLTIAEVEALAKQPA